MLKALSRLVASKRLFWAGALGYAGWLIVGESQPVWPVLVVFVGFPLLLEFAFWLGRKDALRDVALGNAKEMADRYEALAAQYEAMSATLEQELQVMQIIRPLLDHLPVGKTITFGLEITRTEKGSSARASDVPDRSAN